MGVVVFSVNQPSLLIKVHLRDSGRTVYRRVKVLKMCPLNA